MDAWTKQSIDMVIGMFWLIAVTAFCVFVLKGHDNYGVAVYMLGLYSLTWIPRLTNKFIKENK